MKLMANQLKKLIAEVSFKEREEPFTLKSGRKSQVYFDLRPLLLSPRGLKLATSLMLDRIADECEDVDAVCGILDGSASLATAVGLKADLPILLVRKEAKDHGTGGLVIGTETVDTDAKVVVIEDVTTTGGSALRGVKALRGVGYIVEDVFSVLDRNEGGAAELWSNKATRLHSLFKKHDFSDKE